MPTEASVEAIYEYAPGSSIVAGGRVWTSAGVYRLPGRDLVSGTYISCQHCGAFHAGVGSLPDTCRQCDQPLLGRQHEYVVPEFGFVAGRTTLSPGARRPRSAWHGGTHVLRLPERADTRKLSLAGGEVTLRAGARGRLVAISEGAGGAGFMLCDWCGYAAPVTQGRITPHRNPMTDRECRGTLRRRSLAHEFETDVLEVRMRLATVPPWTDPAPWRSTMYALLEGAATSLEMARDDLDGALHHFGDQAPAIVLVDAVPGGAGLVLQLADNFGQVVRAAIRRLNACDCDPATSCYGCLRAYRNQRYHEELSRGAALALLQQLAT